MKHRPFIIIALLALLQFNAVARVALTLDPSGKRTAFEYDTNGNLAAVSISMTGRLKFGNNNVTNVSETINSQPSTLNYAYDAYNRVSSYHDGNGNLIQYRYDGNGNLTNLVYPGGKNVYYAFDSNNHMTNVTDWAGRKTSIGYDLAGWLTSITRPNGTLRTIAYDLDGEATNIIEEAASKYPIAFYTLGWTNSGRVAWEFAAPLPHTNAPPSRTMTYDADNRLLKFNNVSVTNDADGNLLHAPLTNSVFTNYTYDARNRLLNVGGVTNSYDAMNNRVGQTQGSNSTVFVVNPNAKLPQVLMRIKNGVTNYYVYGAGLLYQVTESATATNTLTYHYDYRGSTVALTDGNGNVTDRMEYSLYATTTYRVGTNDTPFLFNGRYGVMTDPNGLLYMRARYYNPYLCRFVSADPSGFAGGLNFYAAFNGNPVSYTDPTGFNAAATGDTPFSWPQNTSATPGNLSDPFGLNGSLAGATAYEPDDWVDNVIDAASATVNQINNALYPPPEEVAKMSPFDRAVMQIGQTVMALGGVPEAEMPEMLGLTANAQRTLAGTQNGVLLGTVESGQVNLFEATAGGIENHAQLVSQGLAGPGAQGFSLIIQDGQVVLFRPVSQLNSATLNFNLPQSMTSQIFQQVGSSATTIIGN
jgi:RHS repeat-associated protein